MNCRIQRKDEIDENHKRFFLHYGVVDGLFMKASRNQNAIDGDKKCQCKSY